MRNNSAETRANRIHLSWKAKVIFSLGALGLAACGTIASDNTSQLAPGNWCDPNPGNNNGVRFGQRVDKTYAIVAPRGATSGDLVNEVAECVDNTLDIDTRVKLAKELTDMNPDKFEKPGSGSENPKVNVTQAQITISPGFLMKFITATQPAPQEATPQPQGLTIEQMQGTLSAPPQNP